MGWLSTEEKEAASAAGSGPPPQFSPLPPISAISRTLSTGGKPGRPAVGTASTMDAGAVEALIDGLRAH
jgi:hypothetical protein